MTFFWLSLSAAQSIPMRDAWNDVPIGEGYAWCLVGIAIGLCLASVWTSRAIRRERRARLDAEAETRREHFRNRVFVNMEPYKFCHINELVGGALQEGE